MNALPAPLSLSLSAVLVLAAAGAQQGVQEQFTLRSPLAKGASAWLQHSTTLTMASSANGQPSNSKQVIHRVLHVQVADVDAAGNLLVDTKIARVHGEVDLPMEQRFVFDTAAPDRTVAPANVDFGDLFTLLGAGSGKTFRAKVGPNGAVLELGAGAAEIVKSGRSDASGGQQMTESLLAQLVESAIGVWPAEPRAIGNSWKVERQEAFGAIPTRQQLELTLTKVDDAAFTIAGKGTIEKGEVPAPKAGDPHGEAFARELAGTKLTNGKYTSSLRMSRRDGFVLDGTSRTAMDLAVTSMGRPIDASLTIDVLVARASPDAAAAPKAGAKPDSGGK